jgi:hypothetical protein
VIQVTSDTQLPERLTRLGEALDRAVRADLAARTGVLARLRHPRRVAAGVALTAIIVPAAAIAATQLISTTQVAASLPQGTKALIGTDPTCTVVTADVEYHCVLANPPSNIGAPQVNDAVATTTTPVQLSQAKAVFKTATGKLLVVHAASEPALERKLLILAAHGDKPAVPITSPSTSAVTDWTGTVEPTVDATKHVNGGCRAQNAAGTEWECYIGETAVRQNIIGQGFLGQYAPSPGVG